ncbi:DUF4350 domain-containing protein [Anabaena sp. FACHB-1237]|uniref:DUF4350 domain-containing protein n=1 Tax=Anabaena sp. FACHB-1237 TaxID=2692769 RepID=UPI001681ADB1|nr:DUF4350 domain-containing protein [Anabaena sp. FACHB-1237]MBD2136621.1 DUF4350 domain-containing protein [Anabaena sp. FACHB-1237]
MKNHHRLIWWTAIALSAIILLTLIAAPKTKIVSGSTYNRAPDGYGAWYAYMQDEGYNIQRWQKPFRDLPTSKKPITLLQVNSNLEEIPVYSQEIEWIEKGNTLVILGIKKLVSPAQFSTKQPSKFGDIIINTGRRHKISRGEKNILGDNYGSIIWQENYGKGTLILATTPHLAANAYQDNLSNFAILEYLVRGDKKTEKQPILVDEYIHGYKDKDIKNQEGIENVLTYFIKTPLFPAFVQLSVVILLLIWSKNRRFGQSVALTTPMVDNSQAYIQALAGVLQKADATDFVLEMVGKEEQKQLQKTLGLNETPLKPEIISQIWTEKTGKKAHELTTVLTLANQKNRPREKQLATWLEKWGNIRNNRL